MTSCLNSKKNLSTLNQIQHNMMRNQNRGNGKNIPDAMVVDK